MERTGKKVDFTVEEIIELSDKETALMLLFEKIQTAPNFFKNFEKFVKNKNAKPGLELDVIVLIAKMIQEGVNFHERVSFRISLVARYGGYDLGCQYMDIFDKIMSIMCKAAGLNEFINNKN